jgi:DNA-directed RNA polymerase II subunit RPB2
VPNLKVSLALGTTTEKKLHVTDSMSNDIKLDSLWEILRAFKKEKGNFHQNILSYNYWIANIQRQFDEIGPIIIKCEKNEYLRYSHSVHEIRFGRVYFTKAKRNEEDPNQKVSVSLRDTRYVRGESVVFPYPRTCRMRNLDYSSQLLVDVHRKIIKNNPGEKPSETNEIFRKIPVGDIPILLKSVLCILSDPNVIPEEIGEAAEDEGGYFIIGGAEKVLISQEKMAPNHVFSYMKLTSGQRNVYISEVRSVPEMSHKPASVTTVTCKAQTRKTYETVRVVIPYLKQDKDIPLAILFRALGVLTDKEIVFMMKQELEDDRLTSVIRGTLEEGFIVSTREEALEYIVGLTTASDKEESDAATRLKYGQDLINKEVFPHIGTDAASMREKAFFLGYMVKKDFMLKLGKATPDDRDLYYNKHTDAAGTLMGGLFQQLLKKMSKDLRQMYQKYMNEGRPIDISTIMRRKNLTQRFHYCITTGNWGANQTPSTKTGVTAALLRLNFSSAVSHKQRLNTPVPREGKLTGPRKLIQTQWGRVCPVEGPEVKTSVLTAYN